MQVLSIAYGKRRTGRERVSIKLECKQTMGFLGQEAADKSRTQHCNDLYFLSLQHLHFYSINNTQWQESLLRCTKIKIYYFLKIKIHRQARETNKQTKKKAQLDLSNVLMFE